MSTPTPTPASETDLFQKKITRVITLQKNLNLLRDKLEDSKKELLTHFVKHPRLKQDRYTADEYCLRCVDRKITDGLSQKRVVEGLTQYFKQRGVAQPETEAKHALAIILDQRGTRVAPSISIVKLGETHTGATDDS